MASVRNHVMSRLNNIQTAGFPGTSTQLSNIEEISTTLQGVVYSANSSKYGTVAIKIVDATLVQQKINLQKHRVEEDFLKEREILMYLNSKRSQHKNFPIVRAYESWDEMDENGQIIAHCLAMEFIRGRELYWVAADKWSAFCNGDPIPLKNWLPSVRDTFREIVDAIDILHESGVVHLDISPENILQDENGHIYLIDFGTAEYVTDDETKFRGFRGKRAYAAMEVVQNREFDGKEADLFSLGAVLAFLLCGFADKSRRDLEYIGYNCRGLRRLMRRWKRNFEPKDGLDLIPQLVATRNRRLTMEELKMDPYVMDVDVADLEDGMVGGIGTLDLDEYHVRED